MMLNIALLVVAALGLVQSERVTQCSKMPTDTNRTHAEFLARNSLNFKIYYSNMPIEESCLILGYRTTSITDGKAQGDAIMGTPMVSPDGLRVNVTITVLNDHSGWHVVGGMPHEVDFKICIFHDAIDFPYLCAFTCNTTTDRIMNFRCIATSEKGANLIKEQLEKNVENWPFDDKFKPVRVYNDHCAVDGTTGNK